MKQENIALVVNVEKFFGLSEWSSGPPPFVGWWKTRRKNFPNLIQPQRRWWDGQQWSVFCRSDNSDEETAERAKTPIPVKDPVEWCGLLHPHPDGYPYQLERSDRTKLHGLKRR